MLDREVWVLHETLKSGNSSFDILFCTIHLNCITNNVCAYKEDSMLPWHDLFLTNLVVQLNLLNV